MFSMTSRESERLEREEFYRAFVERERRELEAERREGSAWAARIDALEEQFGEWLV